MKDLLLSSALAAISVALFATGAVQADTAHQSFAVDPGDRLIVDTEWGAIEVHTWDHAPRWSWSWNEPIKLDLTYDQEAGYHDYPRPQKRCRPVRLLRPCEGTHPPVPPHGAAPARFGTEHLRRWH